MPEGGAYVYWFSLALTQTSNHAELFSVLDSLDVTYDTVFFFK